MDRQASDEKNDKPTKRSFFDRFRRSSEDTDIDAGALADQPSLPKQSLSQRMRSALSRTGDGLTSLLMGSKAIDDEMLEELETALLVADVGIETTTAVLTELTAQLSRQELKDSDALRGALQKILVAKLQHSQGSIDFDTTEKPFVLFVVGVNGVGKTTTIGKLANRLKASGKNVMLAAGDTFRAAAVEQLQVWGERNQVTVIAQHTGADSASVIFDGIQAAKNRGADVLIADTAGRLHNKSNLMEELKKVKRVAGKVDQSAPHEVLLVLDAGTGQNAVAQMAEFDQVVGVTGIALTKLDGSAKGGILFALADKFSVPIRYIGVGEGQDDLQPFDADQFVSALLGLDA
ncbi:signal recognition particle-docking protein FtsY [Porticoccaceae bacterium]|jgi:fused signal recognition particle receptor|nr:signal recognition particle-docking protein FtsY [Porticoccaceae bacterium]MDA8681666.1 signal recognition particle-docking protein FtsY [Porticoccaceae bacterium]MDB2343914.1 signal recognition particle-docking protein FtsY [Porticoccaceae bacterium]MDB2664080.1 signal recognition particle-docking protein FtsY [Porticoccaceae bacterium]